MADKKYVTAVGFVQFDPVEREANGKNITDVTIKTPGGDGKNLRITIWPELLLKEPIEKGDFIAVDGTFSSSTYQGQDGSQKTSLQISAYSLAVTKPVKRADREVVSSAPTGGDTDVPF